MDEKQLAAIEQFKASMLQMHSELEAQTKRLDELGQAISGWQCPECGYQNRSSSLFGKCQQCWGADDAD